MRRTGSFTCFVLFTALAFHSTLPAQTYEVGTGRTYATIGAVPWAKLAAGDTVLIYYRSTPYREKWVINRPGTASAPITVRGVPGSGGVLPVIEGSGAVTAPGLNFWSEDRGVIKIGGSNVPSNAMPSYIVIENLDIKSARPPYTFRGADGRTYSYLNNASPIYIEKGQNITLRNCVFRDSANGVFCASQTTNLRVVGCHIHSNGMENSITQHNAYTEANGIIYEANFFGPLRADCGGNNLKDRSAGCVIRYNWIENGNRQLDLVDSEFSHIRANPAYYRTHVYGNVLIEPDNAGNSQVIHYGGDSGVTANYRKGALHLYNNTIVTTRSDHTTLARLSTNSEFMDCRNNILYASAAGNNFAILAGSGNCDLRNNWLKTGWLWSHSSTSGAVNNRGGNITGSTPGFASASAQEYALTSSSPCVNTATTLAVSGFDVTQQYVKHRATQTRPVVGALDIGAYEYASSAPPPPPPPPPPSGDGNGLQGEYFSNIDFTGTTLVRTDSEINFDWPLAPDPLIGDNSFSVRWTGQVQPAFSEAYTFYTLSDDGVRLWVNGVKLIDNWTNHAPTENSGKITLAAGVKYDIRMEHYDYNGSATAKLYWSSASTPKAIIPKARLYSASSAMMLAAAREAVLDADGDGLLDEYETTAGLDILSPDSDDNGVRDPDEPSIDSALTHLQAQQAWLTARTIGSPAPRPAERDAPAEAGDF